MAEREAEAAKKFGCPCERGVPIASDDTSGMCDQCKADNAEWREITRDFLRERRNDGQANSTRLPRSAAGQGNQA
jgi:hypothetical protein